MNRTNFLIIGSGIAGLNFALHAAKKGHVTILTKKKVAESNTNYAQGGIAGVLDKLDSANQHIEDTFNAGARHGKKKAIKFMVEKSKEAITRLIELGVEFEKEHGKLKLTREGGHSHRRIAYVGDYTGQEIENILIKRVREHPNIEIVENAFALDLLKKRKTIYGASFTKNNNIDYIFADAVILATGGIGQLYQHTTNPKITTGDGIAMAIRAGATTKDLEFTQFHPTALNKRRTPLFLLSETLRGEGAKLKNTTGARFMHKHSPKLKELASRDIVARAIYSESKDGPVTLDISHKSRDFLKKRFPKIYAELRKYKLDLAKDLIPVIPAAHYTCGGIKTNLKGRTNLNRLFAFGEAACTGVHGANRLASNSLLEALVFSNQIAQNVKPLRTSKVLSLPHQTISKDKNLIKKANAIQKEIKKIMWEHAGIVRSHKKIQEGLMRMKQIKKSLAKIKPTTETTREVQEAINMLEVGTSILKSAKKRKKTLGCHFIA